MKREDIKVIDGSISLSVGDEIISIMDDIKEVVYIDCVRKNVVVCGNLSARSRYETLTFDTIVSGEYQKVVEYSF